MVDELERRLLARVHLGYAPVRSLVLDEFICHDYIWQVYDIDTFVNPIDFSLLNSFVLTCASLWSSSLLTAETCSS